MELENTIEFEFENQFIIRLIPIDVLSLETIANDFQSSFKLLSLHLVIFKESADIYITEKNVADYVGISLSLASILDYIASIKQENFTVNKLRFTLGETDFLYDDDSFLVIRIAKNDNDSFRKVLKFVNDVITRKFETES